MKKIPTLFVRDEDTNRKYVRNEVNDGCQWVLDGEGVATRKYDGTCVMYDGWQWYARREVKAGKQPPEIFTPIEHDETTGKTVGWEPADQSGFARWIKDAYPDDHELVGTYELCGPKINGNPEGFRGHVLVSHEYDVQELDAPRDFDGLATWLGSHSFEGIVWHHPDGRMVKLKKRDFPVLPEDQETTR